MSRFSRVSLEGSEELFRPTQPPRVEATEDTITEIPEPRPRERHHITVHLTEVEVNLLLEAIQAAKYPERSLGKLPLFKHEYYDDIRAKLQGLRNV
ncbi:MAG: hypothetical protein ACREP9_19670 [Candidatus Dormibacteraceae bacterium]